MRMFLGCEMSIRIKRNPNYNIFLDDERFPSDSDNKEYIIIRNYKDFVNTINLLGLPNYISFDHDLGESKTGYDCAKYLVEYCLDNNLTATFKFYVHSQNPIGKENIIKLLNNFKGHF